MRWYFAVPILALLASCHGPYVESEFDLVMDSRFPKFFDAPPDAKPRDYKARVTYYSEPRSVRVVIRDGSGRVVFDQHGVPRWHPIDDRDAHPAAHYPNHEVVSFGGRVDIFEQRAAEPRLFLTDDRTLWDGIAKGI